MGNPTPLKDEVPVVVPKPVWLLCDCYPIDTVDVILYLLQDFLSLYTTLSSASPTSTQVSSFHQDVRLLYYKNVIVLHGVPRTHNAWEVRQFEEVFWTRYNIIIVLYINFNIRV